MIEVKIHYPTIRLIDEPTHDRVRVELVVPKRPFLFWTDIHVGERMQFPKGFGVAYHDYMARRVLMAPMPFNILVGIVIWLHLWVKYLAGSWFCRHRPNGGKN